MVQYCNMFGCILVATLQRNLDRELEDYEDSLEPQLAGQAAFNDLHSIGRVHGAPPTHDECPGLGLHWLCGTTPILVIYLTIPLPHLLR